MGSEWGEWLVTVIDRGRMLSGSFAMLRMTMKSGG